MVPGRVLAIVVYAAVSLRDPLLEIAPGCETRAGGSGKLTFNFGASGDLARQIETAGKADLFFSADEEWLDRLERSGLVERGGWRSILSNRLVVVGPADSSTPPPESPAELAASSIRRIAIASPDVAPVGRYAKLWLQTEGLWEKLASRVVPGLDARAALAAVETGNVDAGIVYATDAASSRRVRVLFAVPDDRAPRISYGAAVLEGRPAGGTAAREALACLTGPAAMEVFKRYGFIVPAARRGNPRE